jgi:hypothetical protein
MQCNMVFNDDVFDLNSNQLRGNHLVVVIVFRLIKDLMRWNRGLNYYWNGFSG